MIPFIDPMLNRITMYRLVLYYVGALLLAAFGFGFVQLVPHDPTALAFSGVIILGTCWAANRLFAEILDVPVNSESVMITAIILALIIPPVVASNLMGIAGLVLASVSAIASKFLIAYRRRHIFNPVALGVAVSAVLIDQPATWWVGGNMALASIVLIGGLLVVRKVQRFDMLGAYIAANLAITLLTTSPENWLEAISQTFLSSPLLFAGFAMLTEPLTAPQAVWPRIAYGAIVGALSSPNVHIGAWYLTPEQAFLFGNAFAFAISREGRHKLTLHAVEKMAEGCYDFIFHSDRKLAFRPGQYMDWTLDVDHADERGNRRPFTIASAPTEDKVRLGVKFYPQPSAFKRNLAGMRPGDVIYASHVAGHFTLPQKQDEKLVFIAGGIGITPFRSMVQDMLHRQDKRDAILLYGNNTVEDIAYFDLFSEAESTLGLRTIYALAQNKVAGRNVHTGFIDEALIRREIPDFSERTFYLSGPHAMVVKFQKTLRDLGVPRRAIKVDYFPGFA